MAARSGIESPPMTIRASGAWQLDFSTAIRLDNIEATEEPQIEVGVDPDAGMVVAALFGCTCTTISVVAREMDFRHNGLEYKAKAEFVVEHPGGQGPVLGRFHTVRGTVSVRTDEEDSRLRELEAEVKRRCRAYKLLEQAGIVSDIRWQKAD